MCGILRNILQDEYEVHATSETRVAANLLRQVRFDLLILDLKNGRKGRKAWIQALHSAREVHDTPMIVLSASPELAESFAPLRVKAILTKPFWLDVLMRAVEATIWPAPT